MQELLGSEERGTKKTRFFVCASLAGLALRLWLVWRFPGVVDDSRLYANIAENWLQHRVYAVTNSGVLMPTLSRLPGYPTFLAGIFAVFGMENFRAVLLVQVLVDLATCLLIADLARRFFSDRAARAAMLLAALCPFLANYAATALTETLEIFFTTLALNLAVRGLDAIAGPASSSAISRRAIRIWLGCGFSIGACILLRPDGGLLLAAVGLYLLWRLLRALRKSPVTNARAVIFAAVLVAVGATAPLIPWTIRNFHTFHRFEPLAPRYANDADEPVMTGFNRWVKTWMADYVSVEEIYWSAPGGDIDVTRLPRRAFDSTEQREQTAAILADYNRDHDVSPELDARFSALAVERIHVAPLRYYVWLPALRVADMWLRPRTELFPSDPRWWEFNDDPRWLAVSLGLGAINLFYVGGALLSAGRILRSSGLRAASLGLGLFFVFVVLRSAFLATLENPEPRYTLECYPVVIVFASALFHKAVRAVL